MNGSTHSLIGMTTGIIVASLTHEYNGTELPLCISLIAGSYVGSYLPDIDHPGSAIGRQLRIFSAPISGISKFFQRCYEKRRGAFSLWMKNLFAHRGLFHSPLLWAVVVISLAWVLIPAVTSWLLPVTSGILIGISIGILMHLIADMFNPTGVPIFAPLTLHKFSIGKIITGSRSERWIIALCVAANVITISLLIYNNFIL